MRPIVSSSLSECAVERERKKVELKVDVSLSLLLGEETRRLRIQILNFVFFCAFPNLHIFNYLIVVVENNSGRRTTT